MRVKRKQIKKTEPIRCIIDTQNDPAEIKKDQRSEMELYIPSPKVLPRFSERSNSICCVSSAR
ncbi:hypothetical protein ACVIKO_006525 [Rhizobium ruizarguesonis]